MKAILTLVFGILISTAAMASTPVKKVKAEAIVKKIELNVASVKQTDKPVQVARVYMFKNSRVKKELKFVTKANRAKIA